MFPCFATRGQHIPVLPSPISRSAEPRGHIQVSRPGQNAPVSVRYGRTSVRVRTLWCSLEDAVSVHFPPFFLSVPMLTSPLRSDPTVPKITSPPVWGCSKAEKLPLPKPISVSSNLSLSPFTFLQVGNTADITGQKILEIFIYILFVLRDNSYWIVINSRTIKYR